MKATKFRMDTSGAKLGKGEGQIPELRATKATNYGFPGGKYRKLGNL